jgi:Phospholipase C
MVERIRHWVVAMFENRSFDSLLGHLPHIGAADGIRDREIALPYPGGSVRVRPTQKFTDPDPDPGEAWPNVNVQMYGHHRPESNAGKAAYSIMPNFMSEPYNQPDQPAVPTMDGFATDYFANFVWWVGRKPTDAEMQAIGGVFTPQTAPVLNTLASEYAVFTRWFCEAPTCTFPNRSFYHTGTSLGRIDNEAIVNFAWQNDTPNLFDLLTDKGIAWKAYFDRATQIVPDCAINLSGLHHVRMWHQHVADWSDFYADAAAGALPAYSWIEPNLLFGPLCDYHPPTDIRAGERWLASVYDAVVRSPQWESTALVVLFDEHGGCYDHVPPPSAPVPDDSPGQLGFAFDRFGVRIPAIVISPFTEKGTVVTDTFHTTSVLRTLREHFDLGPALTRRDAAAPGLAPAFNRREPRTDRPAVTPPTYVPPARDARPGMSQLGEAAMRNAARLAGVHPDDAPTSPGEGQSFLKKTLFDNGRLRIPSFRSS